jgi:hypothetical protein
MRDHRPTRRAIVVGVPGWWVGGGGGSRRTHRGPGQNGTNEPDPAILQEGPFQMRGPISSVPVVTLQLVNRLFCAASPVPLVRSARDAVACPEGSPAWTGLVRPSCLVWASSTFLKTALCAY